MKSRKIRKSIFRKAASLIEKDYFSFSCPALTCCRANQKEMEFYQSVFQPENHFESDPWWNKSNFDKECRIFALLLAAEMIE